MFTKLLVPLDGSALAEQAVAPAAAIARAAHASLELVLVHQPAAFSDFSDAAWQPHPSDAERGYMAAIAGELSSGAAISVSSTVTAGLPAHGICERLNATGADLIVMTSHGRTGFSRAWLGSVAYDVMRRSTVPILMLRVNERLRKPMQQRFKKILVTLDGSERSEAILRPAFDLAQAFHARLILLRVVEPVPMVLPEVELPVRNFPRDEAATASAVEQATAHLAEIGRRLVADGVPRIESHVVVADRVANGILSFARGIGASVIAMATHGRGASRLLLGSVTDKVLRGATIPLLVVRPSTVREAPEMAAHEASATSAALSGV